MSKEKQIEKLVDHIDDYIEQVDVKHWYRDELDEGLAEHLYDAGYREQSEWVSVDERLPEQNGRYLTHCRVGGENLVCILYYNKSDGFAEDTVTHWMPLIEAPKIKGGE